MTFPIATQARLLGSPWTLTPLLLARHLAEPNSASGEAHHLPPASGNFPRPPRPCSSTQPRARLAAPLLAPGPLRLNSSTWFPHPLSHMALGESGALLLHTPHYKRVPSRGLHLLSPARLVLCHPDKLAPPIPGPLWAPKEPSSKFTFVTLNVPLSHPLPLNSSHFS